jgi:hypothetical protein
MMTPLYNAIQTYLGQALSGEMTLREFYRWFVPATWGVTAESDPGAAQLTFQIEHLFNERSAGDLSLDELRTELALLSNSGLSGRDAISAVGFD